jgi:hypothetical protein
MKPTTIPALCAIGTALSLCLGAQATAQDEKPFYRGGFDDQIVEAPNGAKVNAQCRIYVCSRT